MMQLGPAFRFVSTARPQARGRACRVRSLVSKQLQFDFASLPPWPIFCCQASWSDYLSFTVEEAVARAGITYRRGSCRRSTSTEARCATACLFTGTVHSVSLSFRWSRAFRLQASIICCVCSPPHKQKNPKIFWLFHGMACSLDREARGFWVHRPSPSRKQYPLQCHGSLLMDGATVSTSPRQGLSSVPLTYALHSVPQSPFIH
jgi:hypothetical protein